jgi:hypothetical protein
VYPANVHNRNHNVSGGVSEDYVTVNSVNAPRMSPNGIKDDLFDDCPDSSGEDGDDQEQHGRLQVNEDFAKRFEVRTSSLSSHICRS